MTTTDTTTHLDQIDLLTLDAATHLARWHATSNLHEHNRYRLARHQAEAHLLAIIHERAGIIPDDTAVADL